MSCAVVLLLHANASAQSVPEGIHSLADGPSQLCGLTATNALDFARKISADLSLTEEPATEQYRLFASQDQLIQWVISTEKNFAHPLATCRLMYKSEDDAWMMKRGMRCDDDRASCDKAFLEFQALDQQVKKALGGDR